MHQTILAKTWEWAWSLSAYHVIGQGTLHYYWLHVQKWVQQAWRVPELARIGVDHMWNTWLESDRIFINLLNTIELYCNCTWYLQYCMLTARIVLRRLLRGNSSSLDLPQPRSLCISLPRALLVHAFVRFAFRSTNALGEFLGHLYKRIICTCIHQKKFLKTVFKEMHGYSWIRMSIIYFLRNLRNWKLKAVWTETVWKEMIVAKTECYLRFHRYVFLAFL